MSVLLRSTTLLVLTFLLMPMLQRASSSLRHLIWLCGVLAAAILPLASAELPVLDLPVLAPVTEAPTAPPAADLLRSAVRPPMQPQNTFGELALAWLNDRWMILLWAVGFTLVIARLIRAIVVVRRLVSTSERLSGDEWQQIIDELRTRLLISRPVRVAVAAGTLSPMVCGIARPIVLLPAEALVWSSERRRFILAHELAHVQRLDTLLQPLIRAITAVYWFNPLMWLAASQVRFEQECASDDRALSLKMDPHQYAADLVDIARSLKPNEELSYMSTSMAHSSQLAKRVSSILDTTKNRRSMKRGTAISIPVIAAILTAFFATAQLTAVPRVHPPVRTLEGSAVRPYALPTPSERSATVMPERPQTQANRVFQKWLDEDVKYLITDEEKAAFNALGSDAEREHFIEQFWARHDPLPGTPPNQYKQEHYKRIAYANMRFGYGQVGGWQTDRGRIYIVHGKPDEIESHPSGGNYERPFEEGGGTITTHPFEIWTYRHIEGMGNNVVFEFVDSETSGAYRLAVNPSEKEEVPWLVGKDIPLEVSLTYPLNVDRAFVTVTAQIPYSSLGFRTDLGVHISDVHIRIRVSAGDRTVSTIEEDSRKMIRDEQFPQISQMVMTYAKTVHLQPGVYQLEVSVQDVNSGATGSTTQQLVVP